MNLIEVSDLSGCSVDELKDILLTQYDRIVLSEYSQLDENVLSSLMDYLGIDVIPLASEIDYEEKTENLRVGNRKIETSDSEKRTARDKVQHFVGNMFRREKKDTYVESTKKSPEEECLKALNEIESPEVEYTRKLISYCIDQKYLIFIDTCSLLNRCFYEFYDLFLNTTNGAYTLYVPYVVIEELKNILKKRDKERDVLKAAEERIAYIAEQCKEGNMKIVGDENDKRTNERGEKVVHADRVLIEKLIFFRNDSKSCLLITQDYGVTVDALKQNDWQSTKSRAQILVKKIGNKGSLIDNSEDVKNPKLPID